MSPSTSSRVRRSLSRPTASARRRCCSGSAGFYSATTRQWTPKPAYASAAKLHKEALAARKKLRSESRSQLANRDQLADAAQNLRNDLDDFSARRVPLAAAVTEALRAHHAVAKWEAHEAEANARARDV